MDLIRLIVFLKSGIGIFLIVAVIIGMCLPDFMLEAFGFIVAIILVIMLIALIIKVFTGLK